MGFADPVKCREYIRTTAAPCTCQRSLELLEAAPRHVGQELVAVAEMPIGCGGAYSGPAGGLGKGNAGESFLRNQCQRGPNQGLFEIAMVIPAGARRSALSGPVHVKSLYMTRGAASI
jgi:hypothetical protein